MPNKFRRLVLDEMADARSKHPPYHSAHEAFAVLYEEVDELWDEVRKKAHNRDKKAMLEELVQIAACAEMAAYALRCVDG